MRRQNTTRIGDIIKEVIRNEGLEEGLLIARVADAWDTVVGPEIASVTLNKFYDFKIKCLTCKIGSSVLRTQLYASRGEIIKRINLELGGDFLKTLRLS